jgi:GntR family transcriptional regulator
VVVPFKVSFEPGVALHEQVAYAARKAMVSGQMTPGDPFPSVRILSKELKINPNTAHKVISQLLAEGLIEVRVGIGTVVARLPRSTAAERSRLLTGDIEQLVVEARRLGLDLDDVLGAVANHWDRFDHGEAETQAGRGGRRRP